MFWNLAKEYEIRSQIFLGPRILVNIILMFSLSLFFFFFVSLLDGTFITESKERKIQLG